MIKKKSKRYLLRRSTLVLSLFLLAFALVLQYVLLALRTVKKQKQDIIYVRPKRKHRKQKNRLKHKQKTSKQRALTAYLEPLNLDEWEVQPLPNRSHAQRQRLTKITYPRLSSCRKLTEQWPVDDAPTDHDPFLPWIHDVFPSNDGKCIQFVAQNKRRCQTGKNDTDILRHMQPQVALFQNAPVKRLFDDSNGKSTRYRLASYEEADHDSYMTRFICRFKPSMVETLSEFNFDADWASYRKRYQGFDKNHGNNNNQLHTSQLIFKCPVPAELQSLVQSGKSVVNDWASLFVDLIPIRTPPRYGMPHQFLQPKYENFEPTDEQDRFDAIQAYGRNHVLPEIEDSGRWEDIPICKPSWMTYDNSVPIKKIKKNKLHTNNKPAVIPKKHRLVSCLWTSASYTTRGDRYRINDGARRLLEWITYNKMMGYDHFYVYDNSLATNSLVAMADNDKRENTHSKTTLQWIADLFPQDVTYINWPSQICNNNRSKDDSPGERSSQYAAESSCRLRFGPHTDWIGQFDMDEYFVPMGNNTSAKDLLDKLDQQDIRAINFKSQRAKARREFIDEIKPFQNKTICRSPGPCFYLTIPANVTMLQAYNCDLSLPGQKEEDDVDPAEKQFYRPDFVLQHFIHYSAVTTLLDKNQSEFEKEGFQWQRRGKDPRIRFADEINEGLMLHTKSVSVAETAAYHRRCHIENMQLKPWKRGDCFLGLPWPKNATKNTTNDEGLMYNCHINERIEHKLVPLLNSALAEMAVKKKTIENVP